MISDEELATTAKEGTHWPSISMQIAAELLERREEARRTCKWKIDDDGFWETDCGNIFMFREGTPSENRMAFCPYCGHRVEEVS